MIQMIPLIALLVITFWRKDIILYLVSALPTIAFGLYFYDLYHNPAGFIFGQSMVLLGIYCFALGLYNMLKGKDE